MSLYGSPRHFQLTCNFRVITTLQKQLDDLLFAWAQPNSLFLHRFPPFLRLHCLRRELAIWLNLTDSHSIHIAIFGKEPSVTLEHHFPQALADRESLSWGR